MSEDTRQTPAPTFTAEKLDELALHHRIVSRLGHAGSTHQEIAAETAAALEFAASLVRREEQRHARHELDFVLSAQAMDMGAIDLPGYEASRMAKILRPYNPSSDLRIKMWVNAKPTEAP